MDLDTAIRGRRSIRRFKPDPVPEETVLEILDVARWAPSWANTQPWSVFVVTGETLEKVRAAYSDRWAAKAERSFEIARPRPDWPPAMAERTGQLLAARARAEDAGPPTSGYAEFFGAPCLLLFAIHEQLQPEYACFDMGLLVQTVCLAAHARGLGTCIMAMSVGYPDVLHDLVPATTGKRFVIGVALGVPNQEAAINRFERHRASLSEFVSISR